MVNNTLTIEGAQLRFRNFSGKEGKYNRAGDRNFCVLLDQENAENLAGEGWNVKYLQPRDDDEEPQAYLQVSVKFGNIPPKIVLVTKKNKKTLEEKDVNILDWAEIQNVDLIIRPYNWEVSGKSGVKAYLKTMYITIVEDEFASKYDDVPDSARSSMGIDEEEGIPFN